MTGRAFNPFDRKFRRTPPATVPQNGDGSAFLAPNSPNPTKSATPHPQTFLEQFPDTGGEPGEWFIYMIGWMKR